ncbi:peptide chain release factor N(5)-glutamine methyltransferase [Microbaculum marinisediminis]|uniref:Release factor glutamine methyltransferase n=1 Tax=Microbaculum marinisediminis TaxID=2931392 RepID=A0AAW5QTW3_9HYPH|nr:peptide chain release factor N(5)-glutamine methyltransferase [Microbaculum sp. A6E488]MCT8971486.1 peptide chain release factor N(5)-glutamine methyltransferase [Microbaculum sp. A6E488]
MNRSGAPAPTLSETVLRARRRLAAAGVATPELDARVLAGHALGLDRAAMIAEGRRTLDDEDQARIEAVISRRLQGEPVGRILGHREFWGLEFLLGPDTLEPRPDSETVVQTALDFIDAGPGREAPLRIADLGTGTGCLLVALLHELPAAYGLGVDIAAGAAGVATINAAENGVGGRAGFVVGNWLAALTSDGFDVIVSNPPYIPTGDRVGLAREVADHDPIAALDGGADGLDAYRAILDDAARVLKPAGGLVLELGFGQRAAVAAIAETRGLNVRRTVRDLGGVERVLDVVRSDVAEASCQKALGMPGRTG